MESATVNGAQLEYEVVGSGEPLLLVSPVLADGFLPLLSEPVKLAVAAERNRVKQIMQGQGAALLQPARPPHLQTSNQSSVSSQG